MAISLDDLETSLLTQKDLPHLIVVSDAERHLADAVQVIHPKSSPEQGDTTAPTTIIVSGNGSVRWIYRPERFLTRLSPGALLSALDATLSHE